MNIHTQAKIQLIKYLRNQIKKAVASFLEQLVAVLADPYLIIQ